MTASSYPKFVAVPEGIASKGGLRLLQGSGVSALVLASTPRARRLRLSGYLLAVSGIASVVLVSAVGASDAADVVALRVMAYACWVCGGVGLLTLLGPQVLSAEPLALGLLRGQQLDNPLLRSMAFARLLALGMAIASLPGLVAAAVVSPSPEAMLQRGALLGATIVYLASLAVVLAVVGALGLRITPRAPRMFSLCLLLVPFLVSFAFPDVPNLVDLYCWGLDQMIQWGGSVS